MADSAVRRGSEATRWGGALGAAGGAAYVVLGGVAENSELLLEVHEGDCSAERRMEGEEKHRHALSSVDCSAGQFLDAALAAGNLGLIEGRSC